MEKAMVNEDLDLGFFKARLEGILSELSKNEVETKSYLKLFSIKKEDEEDLVSADMRIRSRQSTYVKKVTEALRRIDEGSFGTCEECMGKISLGRLVARPTASLCIACKEEQERGERQTMEFTRPSILTNVTPIKVESSEKNSIKIDYDRYDDAGNF